MRTLLATLLVLSALSACAATVPATCDEQIIAGAREVSCDQVIAAARGQFAATPGITALVVEWGPLCPPNARCGTAGGDIATVFANLADGSRLYVTVSLGPNGSVGVRRTAIGAVGVPAVIGRIAHMFDSSPSGTR